MSSQFFKNQNIMQTANSKQQTAKSENQKPKTKN
jgi:hypothetical protein